MSLSEGAVRRLRQAQNCPRRPGPQFPHEKNGTNNTHLL